MQQSAWICAAKCRFAGVNVAHLLGAAQVRTSSIHGEHEDAESNVDDDGVDVGRQEGSLQAAGSSINANRYRDQECSGIPEF